MHCTNCGAALQPGATTCQNCGAPVSPNPSQSSSYDPTIVASPYSPPQNPQTAYGANAYNAQQPSGAQYDPYGNVPAAQPPYDGYNQPVPPPPAYGYPQGQPQMGYPQGQPQVPYAPNIAGSYGVAQPPKKRGGVGLIIGIIVGVALLLCVGIGVLLAVIGSRSGSTTTNSSSTSSGTTTTTGSNTPSGKPVVSSAAAILQNPQTSTDVDKDYNPTHVTSTFTTSQSVYVSFDINSGDKDGYIQAKWYADGQNIDTQSFTHSHTHNVGIFSREYTSATTNGAAELYWCTKADCSDAQLAQVVHFSVTDTSLVPTGSSIVAIQGMYRRTA